MTRRVQRQVLLECRNLPPSVDLGEEGIHLPPQRPVVAPLPGPARGGLNVEKARAGVHKAVPQELGAIGPAKCAEGIAVLGVEGPGHGLVEP